MSMTFHQPVFACAALLAVAFLPQAADALCSRPLVPYCASEGRLDDRFISKEECRRSVRAYLTDLDLYKKCLGSEIVEIEEEMRRLEQLLSEELEPTT